MTSFVTEILAAMEAQGLTVAQLAELSGVTRAYIYRVLDGSSTPSMEVADKIAASVGLVITTAPAK